MGAETSLYLQQEKLVTSRGCLARQFPKQNRKELAAILWWVEAVMTAANGS